ncbi:MAG: hypothetical protein PVJ21_02735 [Anaerolineales bacterium]|jgi:hypothetical protein
MSVVAWIVIIFLLLTSAGLLITQDWRLGLGLLGLQYVGVFWLASQHWPISMASIKVVTGWMAIATLGITRLNLKELEGDSQHFWPQGRLFRLFTAGIATIIIATVAPRVEDIIPGIGLPVISGSLILMGLGMLHLGMTAQPFRIILGLLTVLSGFEALYAALESSILVAAMLSVVNLGLALVGSYLLIGSSSDKTGEAV